MLFSFKKTNILLSFIVILLLIIYAINMGNNNSISTGKYNNDMKWVTINNDNVDSATIALFVKVGHQDEIPSTYGMAHYLEHMLYKGTEKRDNEITTQIERNGGRFNGHTEMNYTVYWYTISNDKILKAIDILSDMYYNSLFKPSEVEKEKKVVIEELNKRLDEPDVYLYDASLPIVYRGLPQETTDVSNIIKNTTEYSRSSLLRFYKNFYQPHNTVLVYSGKVSNNINNAMQKFFDKKWHIQKTDIKRLHISNDIYPKLYDIPRGIIKNFGKIQNYHYKIRNDLNKAYIMVSFRTINNGFDWGIEDENKYIADILGTIICGYFSSKLYEKLRKQLGLIYSADYDLDLYNGIGSLNIYTHTKVSNQNKVIKHIFNEIKKICDGKITQKEFNGAVNYIIGNIKISMENNHSKVMVYGKQMIVENKITNIYEKIDNYKNVKKSQVIKIAKQLFVPENTSLLIVSNKIPFN